MSAPRAAARRVAPLLAATLLGTVAVQGIGATARAEEPSNPFAGYVSSAWAAPVKFEIYEPNIPMPADPQLELELGYSVVKADSGSGKGRGSWMWPGDPIGDGLKTIVEQMGLPSQLGENGYPVQVNAGYPSDVQSASQEPVPGMVMRTSASEKETSAEVGFSPDSNIAALPSSGATAPSTGGLLGIPGLPQLPVLGQVLDLTQVPTMLAQFGKSTSTSPGGNTAAMAGLPPQLAALIDFSGYSSTSRSTLDKGVVTTTAQAALGDVRLLGGLVRLEGVTARHVTTSDGVKATSEGETTVGGISVLGTRFAWTAKGFEVGGQQIPGLPDDPNLALQMLGITLTQPKVTKSAEGLKGEGLSEGLKITLDANVLGQALKALPLQQLVNMIPEQGKQLKTVLGLVVGLSPKVVMTLGNAGSLTETVKAQPVPGPDSSPSATPSADPDAEATTPDAEPSTGAGAGGGSSSGGAGGSSAGGAPLPSVGAPGSPTDPVVTASPGTPELAAAPMGAGLPPLNSLPGFLTILALALAGAAGTWLRRAGLLALGTGGACHHGLDSGLPDLRKV